MVNVGALSRGGRDDIDYLRHNLEVGSSRVTDTQWGLLWKLSLEPVENEEVGVEDSSLLRDSLFMKSEQRREDLLYSPEMAVVMFKELP